MRGALRGTWCDVRGAIERGARLRPTLMAEALLAGALAVAGCRAQPAVDPLALNGNWITVSNQSAADWSDVDIRLNTYYRFVVRRIPAGGRTQIPLDGFVAGYGQRFDFKRAQIRDLRLTAKRPDGQSMELVKEFERGGLAGALDGLGRKP